MKFKDINLKAFLQEALDEIQFEEMMPVQEEVIPLVLDGKSLIVQSQTGTGKTHSFLIPILNQIDENLDEVQALITAPSRELAEQLYQVAQELVNNNHQIRLAKYIGGTDKQRQIDKLKNGSQPHVVIGTPGRIFDLMSEHVLWVQTAKYLVVDEADMTMDLGFLNLVDEIASRMPKDLQMMVFSATIPQILQVFLNKYMTAPQTIRMDKKEVISHTIDNYALYTRSRNKLDLLYKILNLGQPYLALIFCNTKLDADQVTQYLQDLGMKVAKIHGDINPRERKRIMKQIRNLDFQFVVATDLAARGIDIPGTSLVVNMDIPTELEFFIHRVGRTGRNNLPGQAFTLITPDDDKNFQKLTDKGIEFEFVDIINGELRSVKKPNERQQRQAQKSGDPLIKGLIKKSKKQKVKPGYKRKLQEDIRKVKKRNRRRSR